MPPVAKDEMQYNKVIERLYDFSAGMCCGVLMPEHVMKKLTKLNAKYSEEIRRVLTDSKDELYVSDWTLANKKSGEKIEKQLTIKYVIKGEQKEDIVRRISLFTAPKPIYVPDVYIVETHNEASEIAKAKLKEEENTDATSS